MRKRPTKGRRQKVLDWRGLRTYEELKAYSLKHAMEMTPSERWEMMELMRQARYGYKPGELKMDKTIRQFTMEEFREKTEREYEEEIKRYGPR